MTERSLKKSFEPMLATAVKDLVSVVFPVLASPKIDGIRLNMTPDGPRTRSGEEVPNEELNEFLKMHHDKLVCLDGELTEGPPNGPGVMQKTDSAVMSIYKEPQDMRFYVFDDFTDPRLPYYQRHYEAGRRVLSAEVPGVIWLKHVWISTLEQLIAYEERCVAENFEGAMIRDPNGLYKYGRATVKERGLLKIKRFEDDEMEIVGVKELRRNINELGQNAFGRAKRSHAAAGRVAADTLGALLGVSLKWPGQEIEVGSGFTEAQRDELWAIRDQLPGRLAVFKHMPSGAKDKPRHPIFKSFRDRRDLS